MKKLKKYNLISALLLVYTLVLKKEDARSHYGLEEPNMKK